MDINIYPEEIEDRLNTMPYVSECIIIQQSDNKLAALIYPDFDEAFAQGLSKEDNDRILILESCTHHAIEDDIGKVKIPRLLKQKTGKNLIIEHHSGHDFPSNLAGMDWNQEDQDDKMMRFIKVLNNFRLQNYKILSEGSFEWGQISDSYDYVSFIRRKDKRRLFALFNFGYNGIKFVLPKHAKLILGQNIVDEKSEIGQYGFVILEA